MIPLCVTPRVWLCGKPRVCGDDPNLMPEPDVIIT